MINTGMMLNEEYSRAEGLARLKEGVNRFVAHPVAPPVPPVRMDRGTGLDEAAAGLGGFEEELRERKKSRSPKRRSPKKKEAAAKKTVRTVLREKVHRYEESHPEKKKMSRGKRKKRGEGDREAKKKLSRGDSGASTDSSDESDGGSSDSLFPSFAPVPARGRVVEASQQVPGSPAEVRPHGDVPLPSRQSRRRDGGELAHTESYGVREPSDAEELGRPRRGGEESERGDHPGGLLRPSDQWQFGQPGRRPHSETEALEAAIGVRGRWPIRIGKAHAT